MGSIADALAKKSRTPPPPRRVQAPKRRDQRSGGPDRRLLVVAAVIAGILALGAAALLVSLARGGGGADDESVATAMRDAGCTFREVPSQGRSHVPLDQEVDYRTDPPASGPHAATYAIWDLYTTPVRQKEAVHNLEHGGIVIQYGEDVREADIAAIGEFYRDDPNAILVAPYPKLADKIALTAWTRLATCRRWDEDAAATFRDEYRYKGPERFPADALEPGE